MPLGRAVIKPVVGFTFLKLIRMRIKSILKKFFLTIAVLLAVLAIFVGSVYWWWFKAPYQVVSDIEYGRRNDKPLIMDVYQPPSPNGAGVVLVVSGSWKSSESSVQPFLFAPFVRRGYTVFAVRHISQPECLVGDIVDDMHRSVRFIRHHAATYGVDPQRIGVIGGSSGGHLSLMLGTRGGLGDPDAADEIDRQSSEVQCVACFYPPTDLLNLGASTENLGDGGPPKSFRKGFGPRGETIDQWKVLGRELSPIYHITSNLPPIFIVHGDADTLVPVDQSQRFVDAINELNGKLEGSPAVNIKLDVRGEKGHGWPTMILDIPRFADWFDLHLSVNQ